MGVKFQELDSRIYYGGGDHREKVCMFKGEGTSWASQSVARKWECLYSENKKDMLVAAGISSKSVMENQLVEEGKCQAVKRHEQELKSL